MYNNNIMLINNIMSKINNKLIMKLLIFNR